MGFAFYTAIIILPQRFQAVNHVSASRAGVLLLTLTLTLPLFSLISGGILAKKPGMTYSLLIFGAALVLTATACFSDLSVDHLVSDRQYGFEVLMGSGLGVLSSTQYVALKLTFLNRDTATGTGAIYMLRAMGGSIGLAVCDAMLSSRLDNDLPMVLSDNPELIRIAKESLNTASGFSADQLALVRQVYGRGYNDGLQVMIAFAGANVVVAGLLFLNTYRRGGIDGIVAAAKMSEEQRDPRASP